MSNRVQNPFSVFTDVDGSPIDEGYIYIGESGLNPLSNPLQAYWDSDMTIPANNIRTVGGYPSFNGSPGTLYVESAYSILIKNKKGAIVFSSITPLVDLFDTITVSDSIIVGASGERTTLDGTNILFEDDDFNYIWADTVGGAIAIGTNGRAKTPTEGNVYFQTDGDTTFLGIVYVEGGIVTPDENISGELSVDTINEYSSGESVSLPDGLKTDAIEEITSGGGVAVQGEGSGGLKTKVLEIGPWDMDTDTLASVAHGLTYLDSIRSITVLIRNDDDTLISEFIVAGYTYTSSTSVGLSRTLSGLFDSTDYDDTTNDYNRGWVTIVYDTDYTP